MQLPAQFTHVVDAHGQATASHGFDVLRREPGETGIRQIRLGDLAEHIARTGPGNDQGTEIGGDIGHANRAALGQALAKQVHIVRGGNGCTDDVEMVFTQARDGELTPQFAGGRERISQRHAALRRQFGA